MHNRLAILTKQIMAPNYRGGRTSESKDNSQLVLGLYLLENSEGVSTVPRYETKPKILEFLSDQLSGGIILASKSFYDQRSLDELAEEFRTKYNGSGGCCCGDKYHSIEFATNSIEEILHGDFS